LEDAVNYGFVSAGGGEWYSRSIRKLSAGARIFTRVPKADYVGVGIVTGEPMPFAEVTDGSTTGHERRRSGHGDGLAGPEAVQARPLVAARGARRSYREHVPGESG
jgi:hypothetical protein